MKCEECGAWTSVKETRAAPNNTRRRRIECANGHRFTTLEKIIVSKTSVCEEPEVAQVGSKPRLSVVRHWINGASSAFKLGRREGPRD